MDKPIRPKEFIENLPEGTLLNSENAKQLIEVYDKFRKFEWKGKCNICKAILTRDELRYHNPRAFLITCTAHRDYEVCYNLGRVREDLNIVVPPLELF
jgi:hypothetical protein